jgi:O-antigen ligase
LIAQRGIVAGIFLSLIILTFDAINRYAMNQIASPGKDLWAIYGDMGRAASATLTLVWVGFACLYQQLAPRAARTVLALLALFISTQFTIDLNLIGLVLGTVAALFALKFPRTAIGLVTGGSAVLIAGAPLIYAVLAKFTLGLAPEGELPLSYGRRAQMWEVAVQLIQQKPLAGWGLGAISLFDRPILYGGQEWPLIQLHPHAAPLHIWVETGGIGAFLAAITVVLGGGVAISIFGRYRVATSALVGGLTFLALNWGFSHAAWREWVWASFAALLAFSFTLRNPRRWGARMQAERAL